MLVSGNILSSAENEERIRCHFQGKQYLGWRAVRDKLKELKETLANRPIRYMGGTLLLYGKLVMVMGVVRVALWIVGCVGVDDVVFLLLLRSARQLEGYRRGCW